MLLICVLFFIPIYYLIISTFKTQNEIVKSPLAFPAHFTFQNYEKHLKQLTFSEALGILYLLQPFQ